MGWPKHKRRNTGIAAAQFWAALIKEVGLRKTACILKVDPRTLRRWASGEDCSPIEAVVQVIESLWPYRRESVVGVDYVLDGNTRVAGVGQYTIAAANGKLLEEIDDANTRDWSKQCQEQS